MISTSPTLAAVALLALVSVALQVRRQGAPSVPVG
jgi:hypothetical protein